MSLFTSGIPYIDGVLIIDFPAVAHPDNHDDEPGFIFLENDPIGPDAETIKSLLRTAEPLDVALERGRVPGQDQQLGLDDLLHRPVDLQELVQRFVQERELVHSDP